LGGEGVFERRAQACGGGVSVDHHAVGLLETCGQSGAYEGAVRDERVRQVVFLRWWHERMSVQEEGILRRGCACGDEEVLSRRFQSIILMSSEWGLK